MKKSSRSRKISKSKNARHSKRNRKSMKRMRGGSVYEHKFINDVNGIPVPNSNIVKIKNKGNKEVQYGIYYDHGIDGEHFIKIGKLNDSGNLVDIDEQTTRIIETEYTITKNPTKNPTKNSTPWEKIRKHVVHPKVTPTSRSSGRRFNWSEENY